MVMCPMMANATLTTGPGQGFADSRSDRESRGEGTRRGTRQGTSRSCAMQAVPAIGPPFSTCYDDGRVAQAWLAWDRRSQRNGLCPRRLY